MSAPEPTQVGETLGRMLLLAAVDLDELEEARQVFQVAIISLTCERAASQDIADLRVICDRTQEAIDADNFDVRLSVASTPDWQKQHTTAR